MAGAQPTDEEIDQICAIAGVDGSQARILLRNNNNDVNSAVNAWFEDPDKALIPVQTAPNTWQYQDNIPYSEDAPMLGPPALSRPPSRADGSLQDLSAEHAAASSSNGKTLKEQEELADAELQRAVANSLKDSQPGQENGVVSAGGTFGPATRGHYNPADWAMVSTSREIIEHPYPSKRRRLGEVPAFLRGSKDTGYLGSLLTIYHNIPLARAALLMPALNVHTYAHDNSWWAGATDENTKALSSDHSAEVDQDQRNLLAEVQCLMAFLDGTNRAYGSVDALANLQAVRNQGGHAGLPERFLAAWTSAALKQAPDDQLTQVFGSMAVKGGPDGEVGNKVLYCVEPYVTHKPEETLTDLLDNTIWNDDSTTIDDVWISHCAEVFTVSIQDPSNVAGPIDLSLDPVWYADRYMLECREEMQEIRRQVQLVNRQKDQLVHVKRRCQILTLPDNRTLDITETLSAASEATNVVVGQRITSNSHQHGRQLEVENSVSQTDANELNSELQNVLQKIRARLTALDQRMEDLRVQARQIAQQLTKPVPERPGVPHRRYVLQGVATKPGITYFRRHNPSNNLLEDETMDDDDEHDYEWWRSAWQDDVPSEAVHPPMVGPVTQAQAEAAGSSSTNPSSPFSIIPVSETDVLEAVKIESKSVLLVFANDNAMNFHGGPVTPSLKQFVDRDNQAFAEDLRQEAAPIPDLLADQDVKEDFEDVPLIHTARSSSSARELTPMSTSSPDLDAMQNTHSSSAEMDVGSSDVPPTYEESTSKQEMQEVQQNKIGYHAEQLLHKYGEKDSK